MADNNETVEITLEETGEVLPLRIGSLVNDVRSIMLDWLRAQGDAWLKMSEQDQQDAITRAENTAQDLIRKMAGIVAQGRYDVIHASLDNFKVKDGTVTITGKGIADDRAVVKLNQVGNKALKIVVADEGQFDQEQPRTEEADKDQPDLIPDEQPDAPDDGNVTQLHDRSMKLMSEGDQLDSLVEQAVKLVRSENTASINFVQRRLAISYGTAKKIMAALESRGAVTAPDQVGKREIVSDKVDEAPNETSQAPSDGSDSGVTKDDPAPLADALSEAQTEKPAPEPTQEPAAEVDPANEGFEAMIADVEREACPYDDGAPAANRWTLGWDQAYQQSRDLILSGQTDASTGKDRMEQDDEVSQRFYDMGFDGTATVEPA